MEEMFQEAATEGMEIDPVSGNDIPEGVSGKNVRDDVDAKLSEGEFVIPAYAVKFFGVDFFEKLLKKAKKGQDELAEEGRSEGEGIEMAEGGLVPAASLQEPTGADNLISQGNLTEVDGSASNKPQEFFVGGLVKKLIGGGSSGGGSSKDNDTVFGSGDYSPDKYKSSWNAADYGVGFSTAPGAASPTPVASVQCPEGFVLDKEKNVCVPKNQAKPNAVKPDTEPRTGGDRTGTTGSVGGSSTGKGDSGLGFGGDWTKDFDYSDTDKLVSETLSTLGVDKDGEIKAASEGRFGLGKGITDKLSGGNALALGASMVNPALGMAVKGYQTASAMSKASVANANALHLESMGKKAEANRIREAAKQYAEDKGIADRFGIKEDDYNGTARYAKALKEGLFGKPKTTTSSLQTAQRSAPSSTANTVNERVGEGDGSSLNGGYNDGGYNNQGKTRDQSGYSDSGDDDSDDGGAFAKGGLVTKPKKKSSAKKGKSKVNSKKGLGRKTK